MRNVWTPQLQYTLGAVGVIGGAASLLYSGYKAVKAGNDEKSAQGDANNLKRPYEKIQDEYYQNQNTAKELASGGIPIDTKNYLQEQRDRGFSSSADALKQGGGGPNDFAHLNSIYDDSLKNESAEDAQQHFANIQYLMGVNKDIAGQKTTQWGVNEYQPFESKLKEIQDRKVAAKTNQNNAVNEGIGSLTSITTTLQNRADANAGRGDAGGGSQAVTNDRAYDPGWYGADSIDS